MQQEEAMREDRKRREALKEEERKRELEEEKIQEAKEVDLSSFVRIISRLSASFVSV